MAYINSRKRKDGSTAHTVRIRIKRDGAIIHEETKTFDGRVMSRRDVQRWALKREVDLAAPGARVGPQSTMTLDRAIERYCLEYAGWGRSKNADLKRLRSAQIARMALAQIRPSHLIDHIRARRAGGAGPATAGNDLTWLRVLYKVARPAWGVPVSLTVVDDAIQHCREQRLISRGEQRDRRPTLEELTQILTWYQRGDGRQAIPMDEIVLFAVFSARRQEEICRLQRADYDQDKKTILVRDMKDPRVKGVSARLSLPTEAAAVLERQPAGNLFFPYNSRSISASFTRACKMLGIEDLHFHDLRHEATSRLFELGWTIPQVAAVTGHRSWQNLQRYTHLAGPQVVDKYRGWRFRPACEFGTGHKRYGEGALKA